MRKKRALILLAHGSRAKETPLEMKAMEALFKAARRGLTVRGAFLSLATPDLETALDQVIAEGCADIRVLPLFLFPGKHVLEDIPALTQSLQAKHPSIQLDLLPPIGRHPGFVGLILAAAGFG